MFKKGKSLGILSAGGLLGNCFSGNSVVKCEDNFVYFMKSGRFVHFQASDGQRRIADSVKAFQDVNLAPYETLQAQSPDSIDLEVAEKLGVVTSEVRARIEEVMPDYQQIFESALAAERREAKTVEQQEAAYKRALEHLIGKVAFEAETGLDEPGKAPDAFNKLFVDKVSKALKFEIDPEHGLKGRSELQSASRRLRMLTFDKKNDDRLSKLTADAAKAKTDRDAAQAEVQFLDTHTSGKFANLADLKQQTQAVGLRGPVAGDVFAIFGSLESIVDGMSELEDSKIPASLKGSEVSKAYEECVKQVGNINKAATPAPALLEDLVNQLETLEQEIEKKRTNLSDLEDKLQEANGAVSNSGMLGASLLRKNAEQITDLEGKLTAERAKTTPDADLIARLDTRLKDLRSKESDYPAWVLGKAFDPKHSDAQINEFERTHLEATDAHADFKVTYEYFRKGSELKELGKSEKALQETIQQLAEIQTPGETFKAAKARLQGEINALGAVRVNIPTGNARESAIRTRMADAGTRRRIDAKFEALKTEALAKRAEAVTDKEKKDLRKQARESVKTELATPPQDQVDGEVGRLMGESETKADIEAARKGLWDAKTKELHRDLTDDENAAILKQATEQVKGKIEAKVRADLATDLETEVAKKLRSADSKKRIEEAYQQLFQAAYGQFEQLELDTLRARAGQDIQRDVEREFVRGYVVDDLEFKREAEKNKDKVTLIQKAEQQSKELYDKLDRCVDQLEIAHKAGVTLDFGAGVTFDSVKTEFGTINLGKDDFDPKSLTELYAKVQIAFNTANIKGLLTALDAKMADKQKAVKDSKKALDDAKVDQAKNEKLTDANAAKRVLEVILAEQIEAGLLPKMTPPEQKMLIKMILAGDIATIQSAEDYATLAKRGSAETLETIKQALFKQKLINMRFKYGEKTVHPFKGLKPENFNTPEKVEALFRTGRLTCDLAKAKESGSLEHVSAFLLLASFKIFDEGADKPSKQAIKLEQLIKQKIAQTLKVDKKLDEASGYGSTVDGLYEQYLALVRGKTQEWFNHYDKNHAEWDAYKVQELENRYRLLKEQLRLGKLGDPEKDGKTVFKKRREDLLEKADEYGVKDKLSFAKESLVDGFGNSKAAWWLGNLGYDVGEYLKGKGAAVGIGSLKTGFVGAGKTAYWGAGLGVMGTLGLGYALVKSPWYLLKTLASPFRKGTIKGHLTDIWGGVKGDVGKVAGYTKEKAKAAWTGTKESFSHMGTEWKKAAWKRHEYKDRTKVDLTAIEEGAKELEAKADFAPVEVGAIDFPDLEEAKTAISDIDKMQKNEPEQKAA